MADEGRSILFSRHNTQDVEQISDRINFIDPRRIIDSMDKEGTLTAGASCASKSLRESRYLPYPQSSQCSSTEGWRSRLLMRLCRTSQTHMKGPGPAFNMSSVLPRMQSATKNKKTTSGEDIEMALTWKCPRLTHITAHFCSLLTPSNRRSLNRQRGFRLLTRVAPEGGL